MEKVGIRKEERFAPGIDGDEISLAVFSMSREPTEPPRKEVPNKEQVWDQPYYAWRLIDENHEVDEPKRTTTDIA
jgi:hypothetical protein